MDTNFPNVPKFKTKIRWNTRLTQKITTQPNVIKKFDEYFNLYSLNKVHEQLWIFKMRSIIAHLRKKNHRLDQAKLLYFSFQYLNLNCNHSFLELEPL